MSTMATHCNFADMGKMSNFIFIFILSDIDQTSEIKIRQTEKNKSVAFSIILIQAKGFGSKVFLSAQRGAGLQAANNC